MAFQASDFYQPSGGLAAQGPCLGGIRIVELDETYLEDYLQVQYQDHLQYGQVYAEQILADNRAHLLTNGSKIYLALDGQRIVGSVTAWFFEAYVEIDDYQVDAAYQGRDWDHASKAALANQEQAILVAEEANRPMYHHQGYKEVASYWIALRSDSRQTKDD